MSKLKITELNRISAEEFKQVEKLPLVVVLDEMCATFHLIFCTFAHKIEHR